MHPCALFLYIRLEQPAWCMFLFYFFIRLSIVCSLYGTNVFNTHATAVIQGAARVHCIHSYWSDHHVHVLLGIDVYSYCLEFSVELLYCCLPHDHSPYHIPITITYTHNTTTHIHTHMYISHGHAAKKRRLPVPEGGASHRGGPSCWGGSPGELHATS